MSRIKEPIDEQASDARGQMKEAAAQTAQGLRDLGTQAKEVAREQYENLRQQTQEYYQQGRKKFGEYQDSVEHYVQEKPITSLLIAAGVGALLGILWKRR